MRFLPSILPSILPSNRTLLTFGLLSVPALALGNVFGFISLTTALWTGGWIASVLSALGLANSVPDSSLKTVARLKNELSLKKGEIESLQKEMKVLQNNNLNIEELKGTVTKLEEECTNLRAEGKKAQEALASATAEIDALKKVVAEKDTLLNETLADKLLLNASLEVALREKVDLVKAAEEAKVAEKFIIVEAPALEDDFTAQLTAKLDEVAVNQGNEIDLGLEKSGTPPVLYTPTGARSGNNSPNSLSPLARSREGSPEYSLSEEASPKHRSGCASPN